MSGVIRLRPGYGGAMRLKFCAVFWLSVGLLVLLAFVIANAVMAVVDDGLGWLESEINALLDELKKYGCGQ